LSHAIFIFHSNQKVAIILGETNMKLIVPTLTALYLALLVSSASGTETTTTTTNPDGTTTTTVEETTGTPPETAPQDPAPASPAAGRKLLGPTGATGTIRRSDRRQDRRAGDPRID
jgi:hypothetical protein